MDAHCVLIFMVLVKFGLKDIASEVIIYQDGRYVGIMMYKR